MGKVLVTRKLHQATRRSPARGMSERLGTRLVVLYNTTSYSGNQKPGYDVTIIEFRGLNSRGPWLIREIRENYAPQKHGAIR